MPETPEKETTPPKNPLSRRLSRVTPTNNHTKNNISPQIDGDLYIGTFSEDNIPNGNGKYLWRDGCMYEGELKNGKGHGKGKYSWPTGATYEGEWKNGKREGKGTYIGKDGETYKGFWVNDCKEGHGENVYPNGDYYIGNWKGHLQDGFGKYVWKNGTFYEGQWRNGVILGRDGLEVSSSNPRRSNVGESQRVYPRVCVWESMGECGDVICDFVDDVDGFNNNNYYNNRGSLVKEGKKFGQSIYRGHKNYDLIVSLQLGISYSVEKYSSSIWRELKSSDFDPKAKYWTKFPPEGSKCTPTHRSTEFRWKDYCPVVFRHLRDLFRVDPSEYMLAICGNDILRELSSPGKSGSFFYLTQDDRFMIKTVKKPEVKVLLRMLPNYHKHVCRYENSLLTKFYGLHCVKPSGGSKTRFIIMGNLFCTEPRIHRRFDLKGSRHGRTTEKSEVEIDETTTLKDLDLDFVFRLQRNWYQELIEQVERDCEFLVAEKIMDYSLLVGIHFRNEKLGDKMGGQSVLKAEDSDLDGRKPLIKLGANMPAQAERLVKSHLDQYISGCYHNLSLSRNGEIYEVILYLGIIDILQDYDMSKRLERAYKSLQVDPTSISAVDPKLYSKRFRNFIRTIFMEDKL